MEAVTRTIGAEAALLALRGAAGEGLRLVASTGLDAGERAALAEQLAAGEDGFMEGAFAGVLCAEVLADGTPSGVVAALRRDHDGFENVDLIATYAAQAGLRLAIARRPPVDSELLETWTMLDRLVLSAHSLGELGRALTAVIGPLFGDARVGLMLADHQRSVLQTMPGAFGAQDAVIASHRVGFFDPRSNSARVLTTGLPYLSNATRGDMSIRQDYIALFGLRRVLTVPLGEVGVLHLADARRDFEVSDLMRLEVLAPRIATIVELATALYRARRAQRTEETICRAAVAVASGKSVHTVMEPALRELGRATEADMIAFVADDSPPIAIVAGRRNLELERAVLEEAATEPGIRAYVVGPQRAGDPGHAAFYVPVSLQDVRVGTLAALRLQGEPFSRGERRSFMRMANVAALNYAAERYQQQRAQLARMHERQRLADDLHDDVAQILFAAQIGLDSVLEHDEVDDDVAARIAHARALLIRGDTAIRTVIHKLSTPPAADVATRLSSIVAQVQEEFSLPIHLHVEDGVAQVAGEVAPASADALAKAAREALVNAAKHAGPCRVAVSLELVRAERTLRLTVADDGIGARGASGPPAEAPPRPGERHGLTAMRTLISDRGGLLTVSHGEAGGTEVRITLPLEAPGPRPPARYDAAVNAPTVAV